MCTQHGLFRIQRTALLHLSLQPCARAYNASLLQVLYARRDPGLEGAQWTGLVTSIAIEMLSSGAVDAVVCVQSDPDDR